MDAPAGRLPLTGDPGLGTPPPTHHVFLPRGRELMGSTSYLWGKAGEFYWCLAFLLEH